MIRPGKHDLARSPFLGVHDVKDKIGRQPKRDLIRFSFFPCPPTAKPATHGWHFLTKPISKLTKLIESLTLLRPFFSFLTQLSAKSFLRKLGCWGACGRVFYCGEIVTSYVTRHFDVASKWRSASSSLLR